MTVYLRKYYLYVLFYQQFKHMARTWPTTYTSVCEVTKYCIQYVEFIDKAPSFNHTSELNEKVIHIMQEGNLGFIFMIKYTHTTW